MKDTRRFASRIIAGYLLLAMLSSSGAQAAEAVQWIDLPKKVGSDNGKDRQYRILAKDGRTYFGHEIIFSLTDVKLAYAGPSIPREQVVEIRIRRDGSLLDALLVAAALTPAVDGYDGLSLSLFAVLLLGATAAVAPVVLPIQGVKRLLPDKVIKVAP